MDDRYLNFRKEILKYDLAINCLPGFMGFQMLETLIELQMSCVDISFMPEDCLTLNKEMNCTIIPDAGVAPGLSNLIVGNIISKNKITAYIGFDITSDSLHIGSLVQLMLLYWLDFYGHKTIALTGGGTTLIGDPSGKDESRKILRPEDIENNITKIEKTFSKFINLIDKANIINNFQCYIEIYFTKLYSKTKDYKYYDYFIKTVSENSLIDKFNLDLESFFIKFEDKYLNI